MTIATIPFVLNRQPGRLAVAYEPNPSAAKSGFDLFVGNDFDVNICVGYPTMHARLEQFQGTGYAAACAWIQVVTRREFAALDAVEPAHVESSVDTHPTLVELGVPFFALGFPPEIFDAPCNNLNGLARLEWLADTFLVTLPSRANDYAIAWVAGFRWGYSEYDLGGKRRVELNPLVVTDPDAWDQHLPLLLSNFGHWKFREVTVVMQRGESK